MADNQEVYSIDLNHDELRYLVACGFALLQNIPEKSLPTYTTFTKSDIKSFSTKIRSIMDSHDIDM